MYSTPGRRKTENSPRPPRRGSGRMTSREANSNGDPLIDSLRNGCRDRRREAARPTVEANNWAGYDPYDALNSRALQCPAIPELQAPAAGSHPGFETKSHQCSTPCCLIPKTQNPKASRCFCQPFSSSRKSGPADRRADSRLMAETLIALRSKDVLLTGAGGTAFPGRRARSSCHAAAPNLVCTMFAASALLDLYEQRREPQCLSMAVSAAEYILE